MTELRSLAQLSAYARKLADAEGETALARHPDVDVFGAVNRGIKKFRRKLVQAGGAGRLLSSITTATTGAELYALPVDFATLWSVELSCTDGRVEWVGSLDPLEAAATYGSHLGIDPTSRYRLLGSNLQMLPAPALGGALRIWYVPGGSDLEAADMVDVFEEYVAMFAASELATADRAWDLRDRLRADCAGMEPDITKLARQRDMAAPQRVRDTWAERTRIHLHQRRR